MDILLERAQQSRERSTLTRTISSPAEREILALLRRPARYPPSLEEVRYELLSSFSELQIQNAISSLLKNGKVEAVYTPEFKLGLALSAQIIPP